MTRRFPLFMVLAVVLCTPVVGHAEPQVGTYTIVESWPEHTALNLLEVPDASDVWLRVMEEAARRIDMAGFYFSRKGDGDDAYGPASAPDLLAPVLDRVAAAAGRGVRVRLLADSKFAKTYPAVPGWAGTLPGAQSRLIDVGAHWGGVLHAKYFLVDDDLLYVGSQNFDWRALNEIHELGVLVRHPQLAAQLRRIYDMDWALSAGPAAAAIAPGYFEPTPLLELPGVLLVNATGDTVSALVAASPAAGLPAEIPWDLPLLVEMMEAARDSVHLQLLSYGVTDREGRLFDDLDRALRGAAARGAKVRIILSNWAATKYAMPWIKSLAAVPGVEIRMTSIPEHPDGFIPFARVEHAKFLTVDGRLLWVGTSNWSRDYFFESRNISLFFRGQGATRDVERFFDLSWRGPYAEQISPCGEYTAPRRN